MSFHLARRADCPLVCLRLMRSWLGRCAAILGGVAVMLVCSCEEHHVGEMPEVQKEHPDPASAGDEHSAPPHSTSPTPPAKPTPVEFFPTKHR